MEQHLTQERIHLPTDWGMDSGKQASRRLLGVHHSTSFPAAVTLSGWAPGVLLLIREEKNHTVGPKAGLRPPQGQVWAGLDFSQRSRCQGLPLPRQSHKSNQPNYLNKQVVKSD